MNLSNLKEILEAREARAARQHELLLCGGILISFGLNIPGPVKNSELYRIVFDIGLHKIKSAIGKEYAAGVDFHKEKQKFSEETSLSAAGPFAFIRIADESDGIRIKRLMTEIEENDALGRLWDIDVLTRGDDGPVKISRLKIGYPQRQCLLCEAPAFVCVRSARHGVPEVLMKAVDTILLSAEVRKRILHFKGEAAVNRGVPIEKNTDSGKLPEFAESVATEALRAILHEVITTPKPGLVDAENNGAHRDMNITTFFDSAVSIAPYLMECVLEGTCRRDEKPEKMLPHLRPLGILAEEQMYRATGGINTHKGAVFTMGILCASTGWLMNGDPEEILAVAGRICSTMENGSRGIRVEAMNGYPAVHKALKEYGPAKNTYGQNIAGVRALLKLMSMVDDSNAVRRKGEDAAAKMRRQAAQILVNAGNHEELMAEAFRFDELLIKENISPGGSADLLAAVYFLKALEDSAIQLSAHD